MKEPKEVKTIKINILEEIEKRSSIYLSVTKIDTAYLNIDKKSFTV